MIDEIVAKTGVQMALCHCHADSCGDTLAKRPGCCLNAFGHEILRVAGCAGADLAEIANIIAANTVIACEVQERVDQHRAVTCRKDEAITIGPIRVGRIMLQEFGEQDRRSISHAERQADMTGFSRFDGIDGQSANGICHFFVRDRHEFPLKSFNTHWTWRLALSRLAASSLLSFQHNKCKRNNMNAIDQATARLDKALSRLEGAVGSLFERSGDPVLARRELTAMMKDRAQLAEQLDESLAREKELQALADEASQALGAAIAEVRAALGREGQK